MNRLQELKQKLEQLRVFNLAAWNAHGSELCAGDMIKQERELEEQIKELEENNNA